MTIYMINGKPHIAVSNAFREISQYEYYMMIEHNEVNHVEEVSLYD